MNRVATDNTYVLFFLAGMLLLLYWQALPYPFQFDDFNVIVDEPKVHSLSAWWQSMPGMRPILKLTYALNWQLDANPLYFRVFNLCCHIICSFLVFVLAKKLWTFFVRNHTHSKQGHHIALLTATLFALHPAHTEVVIYISSRSTGLMSLFCLLSLWAYLNWLTQKKHQSRFLVLALLCWILAVLVKEVALILPMLMLWLTYFIAPEQLKKLGQTTIKHKLFIFLILLLPVLWVLSVPQYARLLTHFSQEKVRQLFNQPYAHFHYLAHTLWGGRLNIDYSSLYITTAHKLLAGFGLSALIGLCWIKRKQWPTLSFAVGWWLICLLPTNSMIYRPDLINDRQIYLASVGAMFLLSVVLNRVFNHAPPILKTSCAAMLLIYFAVSGVQRSADYQSEILLWQASLKQDRLNARAWNNLGYAYQLAGDYAKAKDCYENTLMLDENHDKALYNLRVVNGILK